MIPIVHDRLMEYYWIKESVYYVVMVKWDNVPLNKVFGIIFNVTSGKRISNIESAHQNVEVWLAFNNSIPV